MDTAEHPAHKAQDGGAGREDASCPALPCPQSQNQKAMRKWILRWEPGVNAHFTNGETEAREGRAPGLINISLRLSLSDPFKQGPLVEQSRDYPSDLAQTRLQE